MEYNYENLSKIWESLPTVFSNEPIEIDSTKLIKILSGIMLLGDYYHYILNLSQQTLSHQHPNLLQIHNIQEQPEHLQGIIDLIHPDDIPFIVKAEEVCYKHISNCGPNSFQQYKSSYCFRMITASGEYQLFHHQAIPIAIDNHGRLSICLNIHTNIHHITQTNNFIATVMGINGNHDFFQFDLSNKIISKQISNKNPLTNRENDILRYIAEGLSSVKIGTLLGISEQTVRVHRKNILKKTSTYNSSSLIKKSIEMGWL